jgi:hypothetical protein
MVKMVCWKHFLTGWLGLASGGGKQPRFKDHLTGKKVARKMIELVFGDSASVSTEGAYATCLLSAFCRLEMAHLSQQRVRPLIQEIPHSPRESS